MSTSNRIQEQATEWAVKRQLGALTPAENVQLDAWLAADSRHRGAYVRAHAVNMNIQRISALAGGSAPRAPLSMFRFPRAMAAGIGIVAVGLALGWFVYQGDGEHYRSGVGELRNIALEDWSSVFLNTATQAVVRFGDDRREVELPEGEALFEVAKDPARPFVVRAGDVTVTALGTAFAVRRDDQHVEVTVTEGVVELSRGTVEPAQRLTADQHAVVAGTQPVAVAALSRRETDRQLAWRTGRMEFDGQALSEAVEQMNRYSRRQIVISDPTLGARPVVGVFRSTDIEAFAHVAAEALDAIVITQGAVIRIEPKTP